jgi:hypothetical protein
MRLFVALERVGAERCRREHRNDDVQHAASIPPTTSTVKTSPGQLDSACGTFV